jgi:hypothetical protein
MRVDRSPDFHEAVDSSKFVVADVEAVMVG